MAISWSDVAALAPELSGIPSGAQDAILGQVEEQVRSSVWGTRADIGQVFLAAHLGTIRGTPNYSREQVQDHTREVSGDLDSTSYGREYRRLIRTLGLSMAVVD